MAANPHPVEEAALERLKNWLPKLSNPCADRRTRPDRFRARSDSRLCAWQWRSEIRRISCVQSAQQFYLSDKNCPLAYEPSGEDFLSPCLGEADLMRRVLPSQEFARWLRIFMPQIPTRARIIGCSPLYRLIQAIRSWRT